MATLVIYEDNGENRILMKAFPDLDSATLEVIKTFLGSTIHCEVLLPADKMMSIGQEVTKHIGDPSWVDGPA